MAVRQELHHAGLALQRRQASILALRVDQHEHLRRRIGGVVGGRVDRQRFGECRFFLPACPREGFYDVVSAAESSFLWVIRQVG
jgi:hypothetical protein